MPSVQIVLGLVVTVMTAVIGARALKRGRIVVGPNFALHHVHRNIQPVRFWIAFGGNAAVGAFGLYCFSAGVLAFYATKFG